MNALPRSRILPFALLLLGCTPAFAAGSATPSDQSPRAISTVQPVRPRPLFYVGTSGVVEIKFTITAEGTVANASIYRSTDVLLEDAALDAIKQWKFSPAVKNGQPVAVRALQSFTFEAPYAKPAPEIAPPAAKPAPKTQIAAGK
jgi:TonB family protein